MSEIEKAGADDRGRPQRPLRADARRNRDRLLQVAAIAFAEHGVAASLEDIARLAQVGIGTLYRHFPTREHLVEAVYRRELQGLATAAEDLSRDFPPADALAEWMRRFVSYIATKRGMADSLRILMAGNSALFAETSAIMSRALGKLVTAAADKGVIRRDVDSTDILYLLSSVYSMPDSPEWRERAYRHVTVLVDGLKCRCAPAVADDGAVTPGSP